MNIAKFLSNVFLNFLLSRMNAPGFTWGTLLSLYRANSNHSQNFIVNSSNEISLFYQHSSITEKPIDNHESDYNRINSTNDKSPNIFLKKINEETLLQSEEARPQILIKSNNNSASKHGNLEPNPEEKVVVKKKSPKPVQPREPDPDECCGSGCMPCVFDVYSEKMDKYKEALEKWEKENGFDF